MYRIPLAACVGLLLAGCGKPAPAVQCPVPADVAPASIGAAYVEGLTATLAGPDRENSIAAAIAEMHARDPSIDADTLTDILVAADCPNALARPDRDINAVRDQTNAFRTQVEQVLGKPATQPN